MIAHGFISRGDDWILPHHLDVYSRFCDRIFVILDRSPQSEAICRRFPKVTWRHWQNSTTMPDYDGNGVMCEEGKMRQAAWDMCAAVNPEWVILGDTDEIPTPDIVPWLASNPEPSVDCWYADWVNLVYDAGRAMGGTASPWSFQYEKSNKKGLAIRYRPGATYRYRIGNQHIRMEPNPVHESRAVIDEKHRLTDSPKLVHYKYANWSRWQADPMSKLPKYAEITKGIREYEVPASWLWINDADETIKALPDPIAIVGNGFMRGMGQEIDRHATVIRFNNWVTDRFEKEVGCRTDLWVANCWDNVIRRPWTGPILTVATDDEQRARVRAWLGEYPHMAVPRVSWDLAARQYKEFNPSTGLCLLARLLEHGKTFTAYGFDGLRSGHYWSPANQHTHPDELEAVIALAQAGVKFR